MAFFIFALSNYTTRSTFFLLSLDVIPDSIRQIVCGGKEILLLRYMTFTGRSYSYEAVSVPNYDVVIFNTLRASTIIPSESIRHMIRCVYP